MEFTVEHDCITAAVRDFITGDLSPDAIAKLAMSELFIIVYDKSTNILLMRDNCYWNVQSQDDIAGQLSNMPDVIFGDTVIAFVKEHAKPQELKMFNKAVDYLTKQTGAATRRREISRAVFDFAKLNNSIDSVAIQAASPDFKWLLPLADCVIDLRTGERSQVPIRDLYITQRLAMRMKDETEDEVPPVNQAEQLVKQLFCNNDAHARAFQTIMGYAITGDVSQQKLFVCFGLGANGKSLFFQALRKLMQPLMVETSRGLIMTQRRNSGAPSPQFLKLRGKRIITITETKAEDVIDEPLVKLLSSGTDVISCRGLHEKTEHEFSLIAKTFIVTNELPKINLTQSMIRRLIQISFNALFCENPEGPNQFKLDRLMDGKVETRSFQKDLLAFVVEGARMYYDHCIVNGHELPIPDEWQGQLAENLEDGDPIAQFFGTLTRDESTTISGGTLYQHYRSWCIQTGTKALANNQFPGRFAQLCQVRGIKITRPKGVRVYHGIGVAEL
jgi:putative DNA primase/helicase